MARYLSIGICSSCENASVHFAALSYRQDLGLALGHAHGDCRRFLPAYCTGARLLIIRIPFQFASRLHDACTIVRSVGLSSSSMRIIFQHRYLVPAINILTFEVVWRTRRRARCRARCWARCRARCWARRGLGHD